MPRWSPVLPSNSPAMHSCTGLTFRVLRNYFRENNALCASYIVQHVWQEISEVLCAQTSSATNLIWHHLCRWSEISREYQSKPHHLLRKTCRQRLCEFVPYLVQSMDALLEVWGSFNDALQIKKPITLNSPSSSNPRPSIYIPSCLQLVGILYARGNEVISHQFPWRRDCIRCTPFLGQNNINLQSIDWQDLPLQCPNPNWFSGPNVLL